MLLYLTEYLAKSHSGFHVFQYLTLRGILAAMTALALAMFVGPRMIARLSRYQIGQRSAATARSRICRSPERPPWAAAHLGGDDHRHAAVGGSCPAASCGS
jgi:hypothetical protein